MLTIGAVAGVHGLKGKLKVKSFADSLEPFIKGKKLLFKKDGKQTSFISAGASASRKGVLLSLENISSIEAATQLVGYEILVSKDQLPPLEENTWYWEDLYGLEVVDIQRGNIGIIESIISTGATDVLVVNNVSNAKETMIPMHKKFILSVDIQLGVVKTDLPEGL